MYVSRVDGWFPRVVDLVCTASEVWVCASCRFAACCRSPVHVDEFLSAYQQTRYGLGLFEKFFETRDKHSVLPIYKICFGARKFCSRILVQMGFYSGQRLPRQMESKLLYPSNRHFTITPTRARMLASHTTGPNEQHLRRNKEERANAPPRTYVEVSYI